MGVVVAERVLDRIKFILHKRVNQSVLHWVKDFCNRLGNCGSGVRHHFEERIMLNHAHELDSR